MLIAYTYLIAGHITPTLELILINILIRIILKHYHVNRKYAIIGYINKLIGNEVPDGNQNTPISTKLWPNSYIHALNISYYEESRCIDCFAPRRYKYYMLLQRVGVLSSVAIVLRKKVKAVIYRWDRQNMNDNQEDTFGHAFGLPWFTDSFLAHFSGWIWNCGFRWVNWWWSS